MRSMVIVLVGVIVLATTGCKAGDESNGTDGDGGDREAITADEVNRYQLVFTGDPALVHTGGLSCEVTAHELIFGFHIDVSSGEHTYAAVFPGFDPQETGFDGTFTLTDASGVVSEGAATVTFEYGPAPEDYPGVVRAAGSISGSISGGAGAADIAGTYACFLMNSEVGA